MYSLLPEQHVKSLISNYRGRLAAAFLFFLSLVLVLGFISLVPAFISAQSYQSEVNDKVREAEALRKVPQSQDVEQKIKSAELLYSNLTSMDTSLVPSAVVAKISAVRGRGIAIDTFEMARAGTDQINLSIRGNASAREDLVEFKKNLLSVPGVTKVDLPISNLSKSKNVQYAIGVTISLPNFK